MESSASIFDMEIKCNFINYQQLITKGKKKIFLIAQHRKYVGMYKIFIRKNIKYY